MYHLGGQKLSKKLALIIVQTLTVLTLALISFSSINSINAQLQSSQQVILSPNQLNFVGEQGVSSLSRTLYVIGFANVDVRITLTPTDLFENNSGKVIPASSVVTSVSSLNVPNISEQGISILVMTSGVAEGTYQGAIVLTSTNDTTITSQSIQVTVKIEPKYYSYYPTFSYFSILFSILFIISALLLGEVFDWQYGKILLFIFGFIALLLWVVSIYTSLAFKSSSLTDPSNLLGTALVIPFVGYLVAHVKDSRDDRRALENTALTIRNSSIGKDVDILTSLVAELSTHYA